MEIIQANMEQHREMFMEAMEGYKVKAIELLEAHIERIKTNAPEKVVIQLPMPQDHSDEYETVIGMLKVSIDEELEINRYDFERYVLDQWEWKQAFAETYAAYTQS
jgi:hypothetical protein